MRLTFVADLPLPFKEPVATWREPGGAVRGRAFVDDTRCVVDWPELGRFSFTRPLPLVDVLPSPGVTTETIARELPGTVEPIVLQALGWQVLHASAVRTPRGVVAFCGPSGAGKSTLAHALGAAGHEPYADDLVVFARDGDPVTICKRPFLTNLRTASQAFFAGRDHVRTLSRVERAPDGRVALDAIFLLHPIGPSGPVMRSRVEPREAFTQLLPHAHCFDPTDADRTRTMVDFYLRLADQVPVFELSFPHDFSTLPHLVRTITD